MRPFNHCAAARGRNTGPGNANTARPATGLISNANAIQSEMAPSATVQTPMTRPSQSPPPTCRAMRASVEQVDVNQERHQQRREEAEAVGEGEKDDEEADVDREHDARVGNLRRATGRRATHQLITQLKANEVNSVPP